MKTTWGRSFLFIIIFSNIIICKTWAGSNKNTSTMSPPYVKDTLYTSQHFYIEVNLDTQMGYLHSRDGSVKPFGISSGTDRLTKGINTKEGLFVIQSKLPKWYSVQFDSTLMLDWMGFNYGIGFHALKSRGYYRHLGKKRSSHGCVRISRDIAKMLFDTIKIGTPVLVHKESSMAAIGFADSTSEYRRPSRSELQKDILLKYKQIYTGRYYLGARNMLIDKSNVGQQGLPLGNPNNIVKRSIYKSPYSFVQSSIPLVKGISLQGIDMSANTYNMRFTSEKRQPEILY